ncbi:hypothetical protein LIER_38338 [Lithospermum erythrorhizon]|uniref:Uncharacterized protein n=1 Tax=Lithospermum erythrorhizon TaxID=34254 RepID=A0AAV3Q3D2_LITER
MEEEEEKTKKGGGINLDWDKLFPKNEAEPPQLLVVHKNNSNNNKKRKMGIVQIDDDDEKCENLEEKSNFEKKINIEEKYNSEERFRGVSDREMVERVERMKKNVYDLKFRDGGEKYVISIKRLEDELERRRLVKTQKVGFFAVMYQKDCPV